MRQQAHKEQKIKDEATEKAKALEGLKLQIPAKAAATGKIFGSVNNIMIANAIKEVGDYTAKIRLHKEVAVDINFNVFAE